MTLLKVWRVAKIEDKNRKLKRMFASLSFESEALKYFGQKSKIPPFVGGWAPLWLRFKLCLLNDSLNADSSSCSECLLRIGVHSLNI